MSDYTSSFLKVMSERNFIHQVTDWKGLDALLSAKAMVAYIGFDCTADSLHVGSLVQIMMLRHFQKCGHRPIVLMGGGTTKVGDPSGKDDARQLLSDQEIEKNKSGIKAIFEKYLSFGDGPTDAIMCDNDEWLSGLEYIKFLREYGRHFSVNRMLSFDSVKLRLDREQPLSFLEFNYMILQAYDFLELSRRFDCSLQMGGSDQWGNIVNGVELARRIDQRSIFGLTTPLVTTASGAKMGKSAQGAIWLNSDRLSPYEFWQYWRNTDDEDVIHFLKLFTELPLDEITKLSALEGNELNEAKKILAHEVTRLCHGLDTANSAAESARRTFEEGSIGRDLPFIKINKNDLEEGVWVIEAMRNLSLIKSNGEGRRLIANGGARVNDRVIKDPEKHLKTPDVSTEGIIKLSVGKKRHALLKVQ
ncbi:MAG: tyrosine--tRNA ligase [Pseudomonadota bacterium]|nr:tyrosine--tRNA ligase [Pseudomonadota bacterium]MEC9046004.1 tyrosine--tRNA ligase [Pseudomonadota bacterium]MED5226632.1 tyrosine--tRNA ligase [Pseudomonadota bacterium]|tara:strand:- start:633 stop:1886 length:1254 start_codon:yes stop_codon:yes gene_type:complete